MLNDVMPFAASFDFTEHHEGKTFDINSKDERDATCLIWAARGGHAALKDRWPARGDAPRLRSSWAEGAGVGRRSSSGVVLKLSTTSTIPPGEAAWLPLRHLPRRRNCRSLRLSRLYLSRSTISTIGCLIGFLQCERSLTNSNHQLLSQLLSSAASLPGTHEKPGAVKDQY